MIISSVSAIFYIILSVQLLGNIFKKYQSPLAIVIATASIAAGLHAYSLLSLFQVENGQNFGLFNALSLVTLLCVVILILGYRKRNTQTLLLVATPLAVVSVALAHLFPSSQPVDIRVNPRQLLHIVTAIAAYAMLMLAAIQALMMSVLENKLRKHPGHISPLLPPMQTMDHFLFQLISLGFVLLTFSMVEAAIYLTDLIKDQPLHKLILSVGAWLVFLMLLIGRFRFGWRGKTAVRWTLTGVGLLMVGYFGTKLVVEFILPGH